MTIQDTASHSEIESELGEPGVEQEDIAAEITEPYDPFQIRIKHEVYTVNLLMSRIRHRELDLTPSFQRRLGLWTPKVQSQLIESLLMRIPLPVFYFDATNRDRWLVVDGIQRLTALARFLLEDDVLERLGVTRLRLREMEFLEELDGKSFAELHRRDQRDIEEARLTCYLIEEGTPPQVKFNVFKRINTGGLPLSAQEIRHALNQGAAAELLKELAGSEPFLEATARGISGKRLADQECVLRFMAFVLTPPEEYQQGDFDYLLSNRMADLNQMAEDARRALAERFLRAMSAAARIFIDDAFRKRHSEDNSRNPISKALFEAWSINLDRLSDKDVETLVERRNRLRAGFIELCKTPEFDRSISLGTGDTAKVRFRFGEIRRLIERILT